MRQLVLDDDNLWGDNRLTDNEFLLTDRLQKIRQIVNKYGEENFYVAYSGGKDSTVLSHLIDMAIPNNKIPRVYANTGIEYRLILDFVEREREREHSWELIIMQPRTPIKPMLDREGYPFKSKRHSRYMQTYYNRGFECDTVQTYLGLKPTKAGKWNSGERVCPKCLEYQFYEDIDLKISDKCCDRLKKDVLSKFSKESKRKYSIIGIMPSEGGQRQTAQCLAFRGEKLKAFQPLVPVTKEWEDWFINEYGIDICDLYKPPYNFERTGCKGCPFNIHIQRELDVLDEFFPDERKQCEIIWKPVYDEYRRLGYRLKRPYSHQITIEEWLKGEQ